jgi:hypothetical protein
MLKAAIFSLLAAISICSSGCIYFDGRFFCEAWTQALDDPRMRTQHLAQTAPMRGHNCDVWVILPSDSPGMVECAMAVSRDQSVDWKPSPFPLSCEELRADLCQSPARPWVSLGADHVGGIFHARRRPPDFILLTELHRCGSPELHEQVCRSLTDAGWQVDETGLFVMGSAAAAAAQ